MTADHRPTEDGGARPLLLDLFCGAGGAAMGYHRAGFDVVGVDIKKRKRFPFAFVQGDAMSAPLDLTMFDAIHASPPCQAYSITRNTHQRTDHPDLVGPVRDLLRASGRPFVIENVGGAPLKSPTILCGAMFGLATTDLDGAPLYLKRHRLFETSFAMLAPGGCACDGPRRRGEMCAGAYGGGPQNRQKEAWKHQRARRGGYTPTVEIQRRLLGIDWMMRDELSQAIPPAYTEFIGRQLLDAIGAR